VAVVSAATVKVAVVSAAVTVMAAVAVSVATATAEAARNVTAAAVSPVMRHLLAETTHERDNLFAGSQDLSPAP
jgi:hypothetical protein